MNPEEMKKKRRERERQRQLQRAARKRLWMRLGAAALILAGTAALIFLSRKPGPQPSAETEPTPATATAAVQPTQTEPPPTTLPPTTTVHLALAGDLNVTDRVMRAQETGFQNAIMDVAPLLADADLAALNFEGNLCQAPYGTETRSAPQELMTALERAGVDLVQLANSYSIYNGTSGLSSTISGVFSAGMEPLGTYRDDKDYKERKGYTIREVQGIRIAFVAFTKGMDGMALPEGSEHCVNVLYTDYDSAYQTVDREGISSLLDRVNSEKPDLVVAMLHWGSEFNDTISRSQKAIVKLMREKGVDAIIGSHSHYVQKMELDPETGSFIAYSLGDFWGDAARAGSEYSVILDLTVTRDNQTGTTSITDYAYTPIFTVTEGDRPIQVVRMEEAIKAYEEGYIDRVAKSTYEKMLYARDRIQSRIQGE